MKDFKNISFDLIDANINLTPDIFINRGGITFTKRVLEDLNYPAHVQYSLNSEQKVFAVRACKSNETKAMPFSKPKTEQTQTVNTGNKNIAEPVKAMLDAYNPKLRYRVSGHLDAESRTLYFDLDEAVPEAFRAQKEE
ncbi:hypothetical protein V6615_01675 [Oscillospiraceae bacterium PP1C4]